MRVSVAMGMAISVLFVGVIAISEAAQQSEQRAMNASNSSARAYNVSVDVFGGVGQTGEGIVWFGIAAIVLVALGILVVAGRSGGR